MSEKPENRKTITIKINGKDRPFQNKDTDEVMEQNQPSVFHKDQKNVKKEKGVFSEESAAGSEAELEESFDWILPTPEEIPVKDKEKSMFTFQAPFNKKDKPTFSKSNKTKEEKKKSLPKEIVASIFFAVFFAVILGTSFGVILLNMVSNDQTTSSNGNITASANKSTNDGQVVASSAVASKEDITTYVLQDDIFSNEERAKNEQKKLKEAGKTSQVFPIDGQQFLLLGVASNLEDAKTWQKQVEGTYAKEMIFNGKKVENVSKEEKELIEGSPAIYYSILQIVTSIQFDKSISAENRSKLEEELTKVEEKKISTIINEKIKNMATHLAKGGELTLNLKENSSEKEIETVQQHLLDYLADYVAL